MGFEEVAHTADWSVRVWGRDILELLSEAARAMYTLAGVQTRESSNIRRSLVFDTEDEDSLLIALLTELIYLQEHDNLAFSTFHIKDQHKRVKVSMLGAEIIRIEKAVKAVTWHNLKIEHTHRGYETEIVFDV
jgi:SHS2 domain-containing protein